jgi:tRNA(fMet)-specific endonuclease VapC
MSSSAYLLDTDIASYVLRADHPALQQIMRFVDAGRIFLSVVSVAEMLYGIRSYPMAHPRRDELREFLQGSQVLDWNSAAAEAYADVRHALTTSRHPIGEMDMMIAAYALAANLILVSNNLRHHQRLTPPLQLENWTEA